MIAGILAHSVLGKGLCTGKHPADWIFPEDDERSSGGYANDFSGERWRQFCAATDQLKIIAGKRGYSCAELAVGWVLRNPEVSKSDEFCSKHDELRRTNDEFCR